MNEYLNVVRNNYANLSGRARRREYWMFTLVNSLILLVLQFLMSGFLLPSLLASRSSGGAASSPVLWLILLLVVVYTLGLLLPSLGVTVRRLHDAGYSGWLVLVSLVPFIGSIGLLVLTVLDSKPGSNKWGPNPKGIAAPVNAF